MLSGNELGLIDVVERELLDYYEKDVFGKLISDYQRSLSQINENPFFAKLPEVALTDLKADAHRILNIDLSTHMKLSSESVPTDLLLKFLLDNKAEKRGDNARDFLIFHTLMDACVECEDEQFILISKDRIFKENISFRRMLAENNIKNFQVFDSIASFLNEYGPKVEWLTKEMVEAKIDAEVIRAEILNDITCFPSYVSKYYRERDGDDLPLLEHLNIKAVKIHDFYVHPHPSTDELMINVEVRVSMQALYGPSPDPESLRMFLESGPTKTVSSPENFDLQGRVVFDEDILFLFEGRLDQEHRSIEDFKFVDFMPDGFRYEHMRLGFAFSLTPLDPYISN